MTTWTQRDILALVRAADVLPGHRFRVACTPWGATISCENTRGCRIGYYLPKAWPLASAVTALAVLPVRLEVEHGECAYSSALLAQLFEAEIAFVDWVIWHGERLMKGRPVPVKRRWPWEKSR